MPKTRISEYSTTNSQNTDINSINIDEGCPPSSINNAIREVMVHLKNFQTGASSDPLTVAGAFVSSGGSTFSGTNTFSGTTIFSGTATASTQSAGDNTTKLATTAFVNAERSSTATLTNKTISGSANTITNVSLVSGVTGTLPVANGGTGATSLTSNNVILGNGTSAVQFVAPGTSGNVLKSNGTTWTSDVPDAPAALSTASGSAPSYSARAWVNFNGTGTVAIRASGNVSSITDNGVGDYTVNITNALSDANYSASVSASPDYGVAVVSINLNTQNTNLAEVAPTATAIRILLSQASAATRIDSKYVSVAIFR